MKHKALLIGSAVFVALLACGAVVFALGVPFLVNHALQEGNDFEERCAYSHDNSFALRSQSKDDGDGVSSLWFAVSKGGDKDPLLVSDCEYRLMDFQFLGWGEGTYDVWAVSGDVGVFCYVYLGDNRWERYGVRYGTKGTDFVWTLEREVGDGITGVVDMPCTRIPSEVIAYLKQPA